MINKETIQKILEASINAPSGSNSQPWRFEFFDNELRIIATPEKDHPILNFRNRGTWVAHGALIENIIIAATHFGFKTKPHFFPDYRDPNLTAILEFKKDDLVSDPLFFSSPVELLTENHIVKTR